MDSTIRIDCLVQKAKQMGYEYVALTDHNVLYGAASFQHVCEKIGVKPIYGMETDVNYQDNVIPFLLIAKDNRGFKDLMGLSSLINDTHGTCTLDELKAYVTHCFVIAYGEGGIADSELINDDFEGVRTKYEKLKEELGMFDIALSYQEAPLWQRKNHLIKRVATVLGLHTVAINKIYYLEKEDTDAYRLLTAIRTSKTILDQTLPTITDRYYLSKETMEKLYDRDDLLRTDEIASQCRVDLKLEKTSLPSYPVPEPLNAEQYLTQLCLAGLNRRPLKKEKQEYLKRLQYELSVITGMHYENYFLIVWDFIRYAKNSGIYVGPGRGSAAGSLVSYCLGITMVDPLEYDLLFERFLNPERISLPDIDTDIPDNRRQEVIQYVRDRYGSEHVASIITFGTFGAKQVLRDVGKAMNFSVRDLDMISKMIPNTQKITLDEALRSNSRLRQIVGAERKYTSLFEQAKRLEGLPRHASTHAAGVVMSSLPLREVVPLTRLDNAMYATQYTADYLEERGLIKMDFLGLRNLSIISEIVDRIHLSNPDFKITEIPLNDEKTYRIFADARTSGIFQFESEGMRNLLRRMKPRCFNDLVACLALYRPASMDSIPLYLENRTSPEKIDYPDERLCPILKETYGVMIYQEQAMLVAQKLAGFSLGRADVLRKAISKKKEEELAGMRKEFTDGCIKNHMDQADAERLFDLIEKFGGYGFNKSHAVAYGMVAYQLAYLKAHAPLLFYCSLLDNVVGDSNKTLEYIEECRRASLKIQYPDINRSEETYMADRSGIIPPLSIVKGFGSRNASALIEERGKGLFTDFYDFVARACILKFNRKMIESLIYAGALDGFETNRTTMINALDDAMNYAELVRVEKNGIFSINPSIVSKPNVLRYKDNPEQLNEMEREVLGFNLGPHPIQAVRKRLEINEPTIMSVKSVVGPVQGFAMIQNVHPHRTKKGDMMAFVKLSDETGEVEMAVMPKLYAVQSASLIKGKFIRFRGKMSVEGSILANAIYPVQEKGVSDD